MSRLYPANACGADCQAGEARGLRSEALGWGRTWQSVCQMRTHDARGGCYVVALSDNTRRVSAAVRTGRRWPRAAVQIRFVYSCQPMVAAWRKRRVTQSWRQQPASLAGLDTTTHAVRILFSFSFRIQACIIPALVGGQLLCTARPWLASTSALAHSVGWSLGLAKPRAGPTSQYSQLGCLAAQLVQLACPACPSLPGASP